MVFGFFKKSWKANADRWNSAGYWTDVRARYGELTDIDIDKLAKHHKASAALDAYIEAYEKKGMSPDECARAIIDYGFMRSPSGTGAGLGQLISPQSLQRPSQPTEPTRAVGNIWAPQQDIEAEKPGSPAPATQKNFQNVGGVNAALLEYFESVILKADEMFAEDWPFDHGWVGTLSVAADLDTANGNTAAFDDISELILRHFMESKTVEYCATLVLLKHMGNQKELEGLMRRGGKPLL